MAHGGQKFAFGLAGGLGGGERILELGGALGEGFAGVDQLCDVPGCAQQGVDFAVGVAQRDFEGVEIMDTVAEGDGLLLVKDLAGVEDLLVALGKAFGAGGWETVAHGFSLDLLPIFEADAVGEGVVTKGEAMGVAL